MRGSRLVCSAVAALVAIFVGLLLSVDLSSKPDRVDLGSGSMFDLIAHKYDITNKLISLGSDVSWRRQLVASLELKEGDVVLDLATGTADVAIMLAQNGPKPRVVGVDPSANMLEHGRRKVSEEGLDGRVELFQGDAQRLDGYKEDGYDKCCISFGIRNIPDRIAALKEMARVTRPGGIVSILEFSEPREGFLAPAARLFVNHVVPRLGALVSGGAREEYVHLQNSIKNFPQPEAFKAEMTKAGLSDVTSRLIHPGGVYLYTSKVKV